MVASAFKLNKPAIEINLGDDVTPDWFLLECAANQLEVNFETDDAANTFCADIVSWFFELNANQSFGPDGLWNKIGPKVGDQVAFKLFPQRANTEATETNPLIEGSVTVPQIPFLAATGVKARSQFALRFEEGDTEWTQDTGSGPVAMPGR